MSDAPKAAIRRLRSGLVPSWQLGHLSVGCEELHALAERALLSLLDGENVFPTFVRGEWGTGKSHLLSYIHALSATTGIVTAKVDLNARDAALSHPQRLLPVIARTLRAGAHCGLREILSSVLEDETTRRQLRTFTSGDAASDLRWALEALLEVHDRGQPFDSMDHPAWRTLSGLDLCWSDHASKREKALQRIKALAALFSSVGLGGLVLILDEAETIEQLWNVRSRSAAYGTLGRLLQSPAAWLVLGTTGRFDRVVENDIAALGIDANFFFQIWRERVRGTTTPPQIDERNGRILAERVCALYGDGHGPAVDPSDLIDRCLTEWRSNPVRNPRRLLRSLIAALDRQRPL